MKAFIGFLLFLAIVRGTLEGEWSDGMFATMTLQPQNRGDGFNFVGEVVSSSTGTKDSIVVTLLPDLLVKMVTKPSLGAERVDNGRINKVGNALMLENGSFWRKNSARTNLDVEALLSAALEAPSVREQLAKLQAVPLSNNFVTQRIKMATAVLLVNASRIEEAVDAVRACVKASGSDLVCTSAKSLGVDLGCWFGYRLQDGEQCDEVDVVVVDGTVCKSYDLIAIIAEACSGMADRSPRESQAQLRAARLIEQAAICDSQSTASHFASSLALASKRYKQSLRGVLPEAEPAALWLLGRNQLSQGQLVQARASMEAAVDVLTDNGRSPVLAAVALGTIHALMQDFIEAAGVWSSLAATTDLGLSARSVQLFAERPPLTARTMSPRNQAAFFLGMPRVLPAVVLPRDTALWKRALVANKNIWKVCPMFDAQSCNHVMSYEQWTNSSHSGEFLARMLPSRTLLLNGQEFQVEVSFVLTSLYPLRAYIHATPTVVMADRERHGYAGLQELFHALQRHNSSWEVVFQEIVSLLRQVIWRLESSWLPWELEFDSTSRKTLPHLVFTASFILESHATPLLLEVAHGLRSHASETIARDYFNLFWRLRDDSVDHVPSNLDCLSGDERRAVLELSAEKHFASGFECIVPAALKTRQFDSPKRALNELLAKFVRDSSSICH